jgi:ABC-type transport system substrate-binding protein
MAGWQRWTRRLGTAAATATVLVACGGGGGIDNRGAIVDSRDEYDPRSLDPALSTDVPTGRAVAYLYDGLTTLDPQAQLHPGLASSWDVSADGLTYTFHLRRGVVFHDGSPFSSRSVIASWQRVLDPSAQSGRGEPLHPILGARDYQRGDATSIRGLSAPDDSTVVVRLVEPIAIFPKLLAMPVAAIVPEGAGADLGERPIGTGPWRLVEWRHDDYLLFVRNERYWGTPPGADSLRARIIAEPSTAVAEFESGNVDILRVPPGEAREWTENVARQRYLNSIPALQLVYVGINVNRGPLRDVRVRQALNHAIDTERIIERLVSGRGTRAAGVIPPSLAGHDSTRTPYAFDAARARQLLAEAGYAGGLDIELWCSTNPLMVRIAETMQAYLNAVGIRTRIMSRESATVRTTARRGDVDLYLKDWYADYPDAENFLYPLLHSANHGAGGNISFYANAEYDRVVQASRVELDEARRLALYQQADALALAEAPMIFLYFYNELYAVQPWLQGFRPPVIFNGQRLTDVSIRREP